MHEPQAMLIELATNPLRLSLKAGGRTYEQRLSALQAQALALALLANSCAEMSQVLGDFLTERADLLLPELRAAYTKTAAEYAARDRAALRELGVTDHVN
jgi:hypothetical protein